MRSTIGLIVVCLGAIIVPLDSAVNLAFPDIVRAFDMPIAAIRWVVISYTLTYAALMLIFGRIGDLMGHRRVFLLGCLSSTLAFVFCGTASSELWLLAARIVQGVGAALVLSCAPALATSLYPERERPRVLGYYGMMLGVGAVLGPAIAGILVQNWRWSAVFWFRAPIALIAFVLGWILPGDRTEGAAEQFDIPGAVLIVFTVVAALLALTRLHQLDAATFTAVAVAIAGMLCLIRQELRTEHPILEMRLFGRLDFLVINAGHLVLSMATFVVFLLVPFWLDRVNGLSASARGGLLALAGLGATVVSPLAGRLALEMSCHRLALIGSAAIALGLAMIAGAGGYSGLGLVTAGMVVQGCGFGVFQVAYFSLVTGIIPVENRGVAGSLAMVTRTIGVVTGASVWLPLFDVFQQGVSQGEAFLTGFQQTFFVATAIATVFAIFGVARGWFGKDT